MEPRFFKRGNVSYGDGADSEDPLQWSHVFSNVEMALDMAMRAIGVNGFNGATFFQTWKYGRGDRP